MLSLSDYCLASFVAGMAVILIMSMYGVMAAKEQKLLTLDAYHCAISIIVNITILGAILSAISMMWIWILG